MTRLIVLEFRNDAEAEAFTERIDEATKKGKRYRIVGIFAPPRIFACKCGTVDAKYRRAKAERGAKFGWWICGECGKPRAPGGHTLENLVPMRELYGRGPTGMTPLPEDKTNGYHYEWRISSLGIFEVPLDNIKRKKKRRVWK